MDRGTQAFAGGTRIHIAEQLRPGSPLVSTEADADDAVAGLSQCERFIQHALGCVDAEVANGVEDPIQRHAEVALATLAAALQALEQRSELASAPVNHADRDIHLGMQHVLRVQLLHHAIGDELVVVGSAQTLGDCLKRQQESSEVLVLVELRELHLR